MNKKEERKERRRRHQGWGLEGELENLTRSWNIVESDAYARCGGSCLQSWFSEAEVGGGVLRAQTLTWVTEPNTQKEFLQFSIRKDQLDLASEIQTVVSLNW